MPATRATTIQQRQAIAELTVQGQSYQAVAEQLNLSFWTVRKWARQAKRGGLPALVSAMGRPATGPMAEPDPSSAVRGLTAQATAPDLGSGLYPEKDEGATLVKGAGLTGCHDPMAILAQLWRPLVA